MGVPRDELPGWDDLQILTAQLYRPPLLDEDAVATDVTIGPNAQKPLKLKIPLFVSDMSFGALSEPAKVALARGAELAGTGICSGEGGMLPEEQAENSRYFYEIASGRFGFSWDKLAKVQAFHFKGGQGAKTGTGGHLPGRKDIMLVITGGLRKPADFIKALALGADAIAVSNAAMQAMARACGHDHLSGFTHDDLTTWKKTWRHYPVSPMAVSPEYKTAIGGDTDGCSLALSPAGCREEFDQAGCAWRDSGFRFWFRRREPPPGPPLPRPPVFRPPPGLVPSIRARPSLSPSLPGRASLRWF